MLGRMAIAKGACGFDVAVALGESKEENGRWALFVVYYQGVC